MDAGKANAMKFVVGHTLGLRHGHTRGYRQSPEYVSWSRMKTRCLNSNDPNFRKYGAKGITICPQWIDSFETFLDDVGPRPSIKHSIDRFPNRHGNYEPGNVRWATGREQNLNRDMTHLITLNGVTRPLFEVCQELGISLGTMYSRLHRGWSAERIVSTPVRRITKMVKKEAKPVERATSVPAAGRNVVPISTRRQYDDAIIKAAADPRMNVAKFEKLVALKEHMDDREARIAYDDNLALLQAELPEIDRNGRLVIRKKDPKTGERTGPIEQSTAYPKWEDIVDVLRPILRKYLFSLSFRTGLAPDGRITVNGILARSGHREETTITLQHDATGSKNAVQAVGSTNSYGKRYVAFLLLNIVTRGEDDDGGPRREPQPTLSPEQHAELIKLAEEAGADLARFCAMLKVDSLVDIHALRFEEAKAQLLRKKKRKEQKEAMGSDFPGDKPMPKTEPPKNEFHR